MRLDEVQIQHPGPLALLGSRAERHSNFEMSPRGRRRISEYICHQSGKKQTRDRLDGSCEVQEQK